MRAYWCSVIIGCGSLSGRTGRLSGSFMLALLREPRAGVLSHAVMGVAGEKHQAAVGVPEMRQASLGVVVLAAVPIRQVADGGTVEAMPLERAARPVPRAVLLLAEGQHLRRGLEPQRVDQVEGQLALVELQRLLKRAPNVRWYQIDLGTDVAWF